jgi:hypothetical protein
MIYRRPGILASYDLAPPPPPPPFPVSKFSLILSLHLCRRKSLLTKEGGEGAKSHDCEKGWPSLNHSVFSAPCSTVRYSVAKSVQNAWNIRMDPCMANLHFLFPVFCYVPQFAAAGNEDMLFCTCMCYCVLCCVCLWWCVFVCVCGMVWRLWERDCGGKTE